MIESRRITGLATQYNGDMFFNGEYALFEIVFKPHGLSVIFGLPSIEVTNTLVHAQEVFDRAFANFFDQLCYAKDLSQMAILANVYLLNLMKKQKHTDTKDRISFISNSILHNGGCSDVAKLADMANMSLRNLERHFTEQMGMPPKLYCSITRFNRAMEMKFKHPEMGWSTIAAECGYFDQMHLVKDFKKFAGATPSLFVKQTPLADENFTNRVEEWEPDNGLAKKK